MARKKLWAIHPGEMLREEFIRPMGLTPHKLAKAIGVPAPRVNDIVLEKRSISADTAVRFRSILRKLARVLDELASELRPEKSQGRIGQEVDKIKPHEAQPAA